MKIKKMVYFLSVIFTFAIVLSFNALYYNFRYPLKYKSEILQYSKQYNIQPEFVASVINAESGFDSNAVSKVGAIGLMQILPSTGNYIASLLNENFNEQDLFNPGVNIKYGCFYLNYLSKRFYSEKEVLCAYNAGETIVKNWLKDNNNSLDGKVLDKIPYPATNYYTNKILHSKKHYKGRI